MRVNYLLLVSALCSFALLSQSFPLIPQEPPKQPALQRRIAYSVVPVDGGSAATSSSANAPIVQTIIQTSDQTETVTAAAATPPPSTKTITSTAVITTSEPAKTIDISVTQKLLQTESAVSTSYKVVDVDDSSSSPTTSFITKSFTASGSVGCNSSTSTLILKTSFTLVPLSTSTINAEPAFVTTAPAEAGWIPPSGLLPPTSSTFTTRSPQALTTSKTYDDGMWHTTWRTWNATSTIPSTSIATSTITTGTYDAWNKG